MKLIRQLTICFCCAAALSSCSSVANLDGIKYYESYSNQVRAYEWTELEVQNDKYKAGVKVYTEPTIRLIVHQDSDSNNRMAYFAPECKMLIDESKVVYIDDRYREIAVYYTDSVLVSEKGESSYYSFLVGESMQRYMMLGGFSDFVESACSPKVTNPVVSFNKKKHEYRLGGVKIAKICTPQYCYFVEDSIDFVFDSRLNQLKYAEEAQKKFGQVNRRQTLTFIRHNDCSALLDSVFNIDAPFYNAYSKQIGGSEFLYSRQWSYIDSTMPQSVLEKELIRLTDEAHVSLSNYSGWKLLLLWQNESEYRFCRKMAKRMPSDITCLLVNSVSDNLDYLMSCTQEFLSQDTYYSKKLSVLLEWPYGLYLISPQGNVVFREEFVAPMRYRKIIQSKNKFEREQ